MADFKETEDEFEKEFGILSTDDEKFLESEALKKAEEQINEQNKKFAEGKSTFSEKLYPESNLPKKQFEQIKEGLNMPEKEPANRRTGLIMPPLSERFANFENNQRLQALYKDIDTAKLPESFDAKAKGSSSFYFLCTAT